MPHCILKEKYESIKRIEYIYNNIENAKFSAKFINYDTYYIPKHGERKILFSEKEFAIKDEKTQEFFKFLVSFIIRNYFIFMFNKKLLHVIEARRKIGDSHIKIMRDKNTQDIIAAFVLRLGFASGEPTGYKYQVTFWVQGALVSVDFIKFLFKEEKKFIYMNPKGLDLVVKMIDYLENKKYKFILFPYGISTTYFLKESLSSSFPVSFNIIFEETGYPDINESGSFTALDSAIVRSSLEKYKNKIKRVEQDFFEIFPNREKHEVLSVIQEIFIRLLLSYFEEYGIDFPIVNSFSEPKGAVSINYLCGTRAPIAIIAKNFCRKNISDKIEELKNLASQKSYLQIVTAPSLEILVYHPNLTEHLIFRGTILRQRYLEIKMDFYSKLFLLTKEEMEKFREVIFELGIILEIFTNRKEFNFTERVIRHHTILHMVLSTNVG